LRDETIQLQEEPIQLKKKSKNEEAKPDLDELALEKTDGRK
jgi:hypothetical protein